MRYVDAVDVSRNPFPTASDIACARARPRGVVGAGPRTLLIIPRRRACASCPVSLVPRNCAFCTAIFTVSLNRLSPECSGITRSSTPQVNTLPWLDSAVACAVPAEIETIGTASFTNLGIRVGARRSSLGRLAKTTAWGLRNVFSGPTTIPSLYSSHPHVYTYPLRVKANHSSWPARSNEAYRRVTPASPSMRQGGDTPGGVCSGAPRLAAAACLPTACDPELSEDRGPVPTLVDSPFDVKLIDAKWFPRRCKFLVLPHPNACSVTDTQADMSAPARIDVATTRSTRKACTGVGLSMCSSHTP
mmetsp:Transcript_28319/g.73234  ORF Transcript_28319/g.73234 Transcript_28319/m.73234 type:complete len:303 (+) Transcript_28319:472-1380(+)